MGGRGRRRRRAVGREGVGLCIPLRRRLAHRRRRCRMPTRWRRSTTGGTARRPLPRARTTTASRRARRPRRRPSQPRLSQGARPRTRTRARTPFRTRCILPRRGQERALEGALHQHPGSWRQHNPQQQQEQHPGQELQHHSTPPKPKPRPLHLVFPKRTCVDPHSIPSAPPPSPSPLHQTLRHSASPQPAGPSLEPQHHRHASHRAASSAEATPTSTSIPTPPTL